MEISNDKLRELSGEILIAAGMLLQNGGISGGCNTQGVRMLLNVADELVELPQLHDAINRGEHIII